MSQREQKVTEGWLAETEKKEKEQQQQQQEPREAQRKDPASREVELGIGCSRSAASTPPPLNLGESSSTAGASYRSHDRARAPPSSPPSGSDAPYGRSQHLHTYHRPSFHSAATDRERDTEKASHASSPSLSPWLRSDPSTASTSPAAPSDDTPAPPDGVKRSVSAFGDTGEQRTGRSEQRNERVGSGVSDGSTGLKGGEGGDVWRKCEYI